MAEKLPEIIERVRRHKGAYRFIDDSKVLNVYNFGSWAFGTNTPTSDRDVILVIDTDRSFVKFKRDKYFHWYHKVTTEVNGEDFDIVLYSKGDFDMLLRIHFLFIVECLFFRRDCVWRETVDFRTRFLNEYYNPDTLIGAIHHEIRYGFATHERKKPENDVKFLTKKLYNVIRSMDTGFQLLTTTTVSDFGRTKPILEDLRRNADYYPVFLKSFEEYRAMYSSKGFAVDYKPDAEVTDPTRDLLSVI